MPVRSIPKANPILLLAATGLLWSSGANAQTVPSAGAHVAASTPSVPGADMELPDDLGAPLQGAAAEPVPVTRVLSVNTPIWMVASNPQGRAVLEQQLPGLCERPEFMMFKGMSLAKLAVLSRGQISVADLTRLQTDLTKVSLSDTPARAANPFSGVGRLSHAVYHRMVSVIAAL